MDYEDYGPDYAKDRAAASAWARQVLADERTLVLDTETTGLGSAAEILDLAVLTAGGSVLFDSRFLPTAAIEPKAAQVHGWTLPKLVEAQAPRWAERWAEIAAILAGKIVVTWNADFDRAMVEQTCRRYGLPGPEVAGWACAMTQYAAFNGDWNDWYGNYRWVRLDQASWEWAKGSPADHTAVGDCRACLAVIQKMAQSEEATPDALS